jgi:deoxyribodipyrimidine photo-lyase
MHAILQLSDNFCLYNANYDNIDGAAGWARESLQDHASDKREYVYTRSELEGSRTHDPLWNAAQRQLVVEGKMHGFLRMYWAKKILEWTSGPETALADAIYLNDRFSLDGRDPNGFVGCMWSICGQVAHPTNTLDKQPSLSLALFKRESGMLVVLGVVLICGAHNQQT